MGPNTAIWVTLAAIVLIICGPFALFVLRDLANATDAETAVDVFYRWQTLLAGVLALVGASVAASVVIRQIQTARDLEDDRRKRRAAAIWADLSHHLSDCLRWLQAAARTQRELMEHASRNPERGIGGIWKTDPHPVPSPPEALAGAMRDLIEVCEIHQIKPLSVFSRSVQTYYARFLEAVAHANGKETPGQGADYLIAVYVGFVDLAAQCNAFLKFLIRRPMRRSLGWAPKNSRKRTVCISR